jgi:hypothetical protein
LSCRFFVPGSEDELAHWWSGVVGVAAYWLLGEDSQAERLYTRVETLPECLNEMTDPLPLAVLTAFRSRRASLNSSRHAGNTPNNKTILRWCNVAGQYLEDSLTYSSCKQANSLVHVSNVTHMNLYRFVFFMECIGYVSESGDFATLERLSLSPFCCQL